jgi:hypothetical protein
MPGHSTSRLWAGSLLALSLLSASPAGAVETSAGPRYTQDDLRNYAKALVAVVRIRQALAAQEASSPKTDHIMLEREAAVNIAKALERHGMNKVRFNAISARVESQPAVRTQVNQMVMDDVIRS